LDVVYFTLRTAGLPLRIVIQGNTMDYVAPIAGDFESGCDAQSAR
jgi:Putative thioesterase (yiiD_Cterm)